MHDPVFNLLILESKECVEVVRVQATSALLYPQAISRRFDTKPTSCSASTTSNSNLWKDYRGLRSSIPSAIDRMLSFEALCCRLRYFDLLSLRSSPREHFLFFSPSFDVDAIFVTPIHRAYQKHVPELRCCSGLSASGILTDDNIDYCEALVIEPAREPCCHRLHLSPHYSPEV